MRAATEIPAGPLGAVVHATPVGGIADLESQPLPADAWERMDAACDYAYRPDGSPTPLVREAAARSLPVVDGLELLVRQGALSFTRWTGLRAPLDGDARGGAAVNAAAGLAAALFGAGVGVAWSVPRGAARIALLPRAEEQPGWTRTACRAAARWRCSAPSICGAAGPALRRRARACAGPAAVRRARRRDRLRPALPRDPAPPHRAAALAGYALAVAVDPSRWLELLVAASAAPAASCWWPRSPRRAGSASAT